MKGGDIIAKLADYQGMALIDGDGTAPIEAAQRIAHALTHVRAGLGPALLRLRVPRLNGHSSADAQGYKDEATKAEEWQRDPLGRVRAVLLERGWSEARWDELAGQAAAEVRQAAEQAQSQPELDPATSTCFV